MPSFRAVLVAVVATTTLVLSGCAGSSQSTSTTATPTPAASSTSPARPSDGPSGAAGPGPNGKTMTPEATAKMAKDLGVTPAALTAAITKARASGGGVNLVKTLSAELNLPEATVAAELKTMGAEGP